MMIENAIPAQIQASFDYANKAGLVDSKSLTAGASTKEQLEQKAKELEGVFLAKFLEPLFPDGEDSALFGGGAANDIYRQLMINEYAQNFADGGGIGLADSLVKDLMALQEVK